MRKNGDAFDDLVAIIPVPGGVVGNFYEQGDIVYQIGFQVDLFCAAGCHSGKIEGWLLYR